MRIAYLVNIYPMTSQSFIRREIRELESQGFEVDRYSTRAWDKDVVDPLDKQERDKTTVIQNVSKVQLLLSALIVFAQHPVAYTKAKWLAWKMFRSSDRGWFIHVAYLCQACVLLRWLKKNPVQHLHVHFATNATEIAMLCRILGGPPYSFMVHGPEELDRAVVLGMNEKVRRAKFVTVITDFCRSQMYRWCEYTDWKKINIVHCGLDADFLEAEVQPPVANRKLLNIGRICEQKGQLLLVEAVAKLAEEGERFQLTIVGDGSMRGEVEQLIQTHNLQDHIVLAGWQTSHQVRQHIVDSQALVLPSFAEGLPVVIMESLSLQRPVITTYIAGIPELVDHECGWMVPAGSVEALVDAMRDALHADDEVLKRLGQVGAARVRTRHNIKTEAKKLADLIKS